MHWYTTTCSGCRRYVRTLITHLKRIVLLVVLEKIQTFKKLTDHEASQDHTPDGNGSEEVGDTGDPPATDSF